MMTREAVCQALEDVVDPEAGGRLVDAERLELVESSPWRVSIGLVTPKAPEDRNARMVDQAWEALQLHAGPGVHVEVILLEPC